MQAKNGDTIFAHYVGTLTDGTEFDSSEGNEPLEFVLGSGMVIPGFENAVRGMKAGDKVTVSIPPAEAYGERNEEMTMIVPRSEFPTDIELEAGMVLQLSVEDGELDVIVTSVGDDEVELDANFPLAGKTLNFTIEVVKIQPC